MNRAEDISEEDIVISATAAFSGKKKVNRIAFEDIESNMADDNHMFCGMIFPNMAVVLICGIATSFPVSLPRPARSARDSGIFGPCSGLLSFKT